MFVRRYGMVSAVLVAIVVAFAATPASARKLFVLTYEVTGVGRDSVGRNDLREIGDLFSETVIRQSLPAYSGDEGVTATLDIRGIPMSIRYPENSAVLTIEVPQAGLFVEIVPPVSTGDVAEDRKISEAILEEWLEGDVDLISTNPQTGEKTSTDLSPVFEALVEFSPVEPVAGNPNSLESRNVMSDFRMAMASQLLGAHGSGDEPRELETRFRAEFDTQGIFAGPFTGQAYELDLGLELGTPSDRISVLLDLPIAITVAETAESYMASAAVGLLFRPLYHWNLIPSFRAGVAGSFELGALAVLYNASLASVLLFDVGDYELRIGNLFAGGSNIDGLNIGGFDLDYNIDTFAFRNGFEIARTFNSSILGATPEAELYFTATNFVGGTKRYLDDQFDVGVRGVGHWGKSTSLRLDVGWVGGSGYDAVRIRLGAWF